MKHNGFATVDYHGYAGDAVLLYDFENDTLKKCNEFADWYFNFPVYELPTREEWEMCEVDFNGSLIIESKFVAMKGAKVADMAQGLHQLLKDLLDIPDGKIKGCKFEIVGTCEDVEDGRIMFSIYNI